MVKRIFNRFFNLKNKTDPKNQISLNQNDIFSIFNIPVISSDNDLSETTYFICLKHLSETVGKVPWKFKQYSENAGKVDIKNNKFNRVLNLRPNPYQSAYDFWSNMEFNRLHYGNSFSYIEYGRNGEVKNLWYLDSRNVEIWVDDKGWIGEKDAIWYVWKNIKTGERYKFSMGEILHFRTHITLNGLTGLSIREILSNQMETNKKASSYLKNIYNTGMNGPKIVINYTGELKHDSEAKLVRSLESFSSLEGTSGTIMPLPIGMEAKILDLKIADPQFFENSKLNSLKIAAAFGIKPNVINDYSNSSYSNSETQQLDFYVNTLQPLFCNYEQEVTYKLLTTNDLNNNKSLEIDESVLFKLDGKSKAEVYSKLVTGFIMTPNEAREKMNLERFKGGDKLIGNGATIDINSIGNQYKNGGENE